MILARRILPGLLLWPVLFCSVGAQHVAVPAETHLPLLLKVLAFDRALEKRVNGAPVLGILYQGRWKPSAGLAEEVRDLASRADAKVGRMSLRLISIDLSERQDIEEVFSRLHVDLLYVAPLRGVGIDEITSVTRRRSIRTLTGVPEYVDAGVGVGIDLKRDRPHIRVNIVAARAEGADLSAQLLRLADVVE